MKVIDLIEALKTTDENLDVTILHNGRYLEIADVDSNSIVVEITTGDEIEL